MAMSIKEFDFSHLFEKFLSNNCPSIDIVKYSNKHKENCVLVLKELQNHLSVYLSSENNHVHN